MCRIYDFFYQQCRMSFSIFLCGVDGGNQNTTNRTALIIEINGGFSIQYIGFYKQFQPIFRFVTFLQGNLQLCNKIRLSVSIVCFVNIRTDGGRRTL